MAIEHDKELQEYRDLIRPPQTFRDGFTWRTIVGALFLGFIMMPASMYMGLVSGGGIGSAARWVTVILFMEVAKRSLVTLCQQEVFVLYYMAGIVMSSPFEGLLWRQFLVTSDAARDFHLIGKFPSWFAPTPEQIAEGGRSFLTPYWVAPIALIVLGQIVGRIDHFGLSYFLYRLTSDAEKLPFPMAPIGAAGAMALAESTAERQTWRWRTFSFGAMMGMAFGAIYLGVPAVTGAIFGKAIQVIPIPFIEFTDVTNSILPATATGLTLDLGLIIIGMVLPFWAMVGGFVGVIITMIANPIMYKYGILHSWTASMNTQQTTFANHLDFYLSFTAGITFSIAVVGVYAIVRSVLASKSQAGAMDFSKLTTANKERGDLRIWVPLAIYLFSTSSYIALCSYLVPDFPIWFFVFYGFVYTPFISYATARLEGMAGQALNIPYVREISFILAGRYAGYQGIAIWFAPIPIHNYGYGAVEFRTVELTGTRLSSIIKVELLVFPIIMAASILFSQFIWSLAPVPSDAYPHAQAMWELGAQQNLVFVTATSSASGEDSPFFKALKPPVVGIGLGLGLVVYSILAFFQLPVLLIFGVVRGMGQTTPHGMVLEFAGALVGRYAFLKRFGPMWRQYTPVLAAGYACGVGLIGAVSVAIGMISKSVSQMQY